MLKNKYGIIKIKKGSILYYISDKKIRYVNENQRKFIYCLFHPYEECTSEKYISFIKIKKNIILLFMIKDIQSQSSIKSAFNDITGLEYSYYYKINCNLISDFTNKLKEENLDGWITSTTDRFRVEIAIINNVDYYEIIKTKKIKKDWTNRYYVNNIINSKNYGINYPICSINRPIKFRLNKIYKSMIEKWLNDKRYLNETIFQVILRNGCIKYNK
jgi:hypothetical protein